MSSYRIVIADNHSIFRSSLRKIIRECSDYAVIGEAGDGRDLLELLKQMKADLIILDISMANLRGLEAIREIKELLPEIKILILTMFKDRHYLDRSISAGAEGYLLKQDADDELIRAIEQIRSGENYLSPLLAQESTGPEAKKDRHESPDGAALTVLEKSLLTLIAEGKSSQEIAELLFLDIRTVYHHHAEIMNKLNIKNTTDLIKYAINQGYTRKEI